MRAICLVLVLAGPALGQEPKTVTLVGDETRLAKVSSDPRSFFNREIIVTGGAIMHTGISAYIGAYDGAERSHYAIRFQEIVKGDPIEEGEDATLYLKRGDAAEKVVDKIIDGGDGWKRIRVKAKLIPDRYSRLQQWDCFELVNVQFVEGDTWGPWVLKSDTPTKSPTAKRRLR